MSIVDLDLRNLLAHPGNGGLTEVSVPDPRVRWRRVIVGRRETELAADGAHAIALLMGAAPAASWQRDALVRRVRDRGYVALIAPGADELGRGTRALAARVGLAVLAVRDPIELARAGWELVGPREALTLSYVRRVTRSIEYPAHNLGDLVQHMAEGVGHGVALIDANGVLLESGGRLPDDVRTRIDFQPWFDTVVGDEISATSVRVDSPSRSGLRLVIFGTGLASPQLAALSVAADVAMPPVAARILIDQVAEMNDVAIASSLLREFLDSGSRAPDVERRMNERGWRTDGYHLAFRIVPRDGVEPIDLVGVVLRELTAVPFDSHATTSARGVTGWVSVREPPPPPELESLIATLRSLHLRLRASADVATGIGGLEAGAIGLVSSIRAAEDAARAADSRASTGYFMRIDALGMEHLLLAWTESETFVPAAASLLAPLTSGGRDLIDTLSTYLDHESGIAATAAALGLHRNTVAQRIARVQDLLGLDLDDVDTRLALHLACRAARGRPT